MTAAAKNLTPVVLELGGKNPTIVHSSANLRVAARRIAFGRWFNAGQTCTAPDYVLVFKDVAAQFLKYLKETLVEFYGTEDPQKSPDLGRIVSAHHFDRLVKLFGSGTIFHGGQHDRNDRFIAPNRVDECVAGFASDAGGNFRTDFADPGSQAALRR